MYAVLRLNTYDPEKLARATDSVEAFDRTHAAQPGYAGSLQVDLGSGRRFAVNLWRSEEDAKAALSVLVPEVERLLAPLMSSPSELVGAGPVVAEDLPRPDGSG